jgi:hypothetical protein
MSPPPTPLYGQDANCCRSHVWPGGTSADWTGMLVSSAQLDRGVRDDLRQARIKTATGNLAHAVHPACELGKVCTDAKEVCPR